MELDGRDLEQLPTPEQLIVSAVQYLMGRGEAGAASLMLACSAAYVDVQAPGFTEDEAYEVHIEISGPARLYDILTTDRYGEDSEKQDLLLRSLLAPLPRRMHGYSVRFPIHARAQVVAPYEGWREEYEATISGAGLTNQGVNPDGTQAPLRWLGNNFRTRGEIEIAKALEAANALFFPLPRAAVGVSPDHRTMSEPDFLVCVDGRWGILEIDGASHEGRYAHDQERDRLIGLHGVRVIEHFTEELARANPGQVVAEFLDHLRRNG